MSLPPSYLRALARSVGEVYAEERNSDLMSCGVYIRLQLSLEGRRHIDIPRVYRHIHKHAKLVDGAVYYQGKRVVCDDDLTEALMALPVSTSAKDMLDAAKAKYYGLPPLLVREWWEHLEELCVVKVLKASSKVVVPASAATIPIQTGSLPAAGGVAPGALLTSSTSSAAESPLPKHPLPTAAPRRTFPSHTNPPRKRNEDNDDAHRDIRRRLN